jgi:hypothetical protein
MTKRVFSGWMLVLLVLASMSVSCDGGTRIRGRVRNRTGTYLPDVTVTLRVGGRDTHVRTDTGGYYRISTLHSPFNVEEQLSFEKSGYIGHQITFMSHDGVHELDVTLLPSSSATN